MYRPLAYKSMYQLVNRCPHLTVLLAWMQAYLTVSGVRRSEAREGEVLLAAIVEYWFHGTADPRVYPYLTQSEKASTKGTNSQGMYSLGITSRPTPLKRRLPSGARGQQAKGAASRGLYSKGPVADAPGTAAGKPMQSGRPIEPYRAEYVQGSDEVMECVSMLFLHLYSNASPFTLRGQRRNQSVRALDCFRRDVGTEQSAIDATSRPGYGGSLTFGGMDMDGGIDANGTIVGGSFWRSSSLAAKAEFAQGKPAPRSADRMGAEVGSSSMNPLGVPPSLRVPEVLVRLHGPAFHFFRVHASKLEDKSTGCPQNSAYSRLVDAMIGMLAPWRATLLGSHDPELPPDRSMIVKMKPQEISEVLHDVAANSDQYRSLLALAQSRPAGRSSHVEDLEEGE